MEMEREREKKQNTKCLVTVQLLPFSTVKTADCSTTVVLLQLCVGTRTLCLGPGAGACESVLVGDVDVLVGEHVLELLLGLLDNVVREELVVDVS